VPGNSYLPGVPFSTQYAFVTSYSIVFFAASQAGRELNSTDPTAAPLACKKITNTQIIAPSPHLKLNSF
jgi:hypothetical protein